ncbi:MAG: hypothetical protein U0872_07945 [Planctomycetaceae bacterium]
MICPRCKTSDVYISQRSNTHFLSFLWVKVRCHRCCNLFSVLRWNAQSQPEKSSGGQRRMA